MTEGADTPAPLDAPRLDEMSDEELHAAQDAAREALEHIELVNVYPITIKANAAENVDVGPATSASLNIGVQHAVEPGAYANRITFTIAILDGDGNALGDISFELVVDYRVDGNYEVPKEAAHYLASTTGLFGAYPYARELAQSLSTRLQFDPFVLGLLHRSGIRPRSVSRIPTRDVRARSQAADDEGPEQD